MSTPAEKTLRCKQSNVVYTVRSSQDCTDFYTRETKQPLHKRNTGEPTPWVETAVHLHLKEKGHSLKDSNVYMLAKEDKWFERGMKEAINIKPQPLVNGEGGL